MRTIVLAFALTLALTGPASAYTVTTLADSGPGSLRDAVAKSFRTVTFAVAGDIHLTSPIFIRGAYVTIDGTQAPYPGITLRGQGLVCWGTRGCRNAMIRGIRVRDAAVDGISVAYGASNVVIDHVSVSGSADGNVDVTEGARNVTVSWSILGGNNKGVLIKYGGVRDARLHHNLLMSNQRSPQARVDDVGGVATALTLDMWNNVVAGWGPHATVVLEGAWANVVNNLWIRSPDNDDDDGLIVQNAAVHTAGNVMVNGAANPNVEGTASARFSTGLGGSLFAEGACTAAYAVGDHAGAFPRDAVDQGLLAAAQAALGPAPFATPPEACR